MKEIQQDDVSWEYIEEAKHFMRNVAHEKVSGGNNTCIYYSAYCCYYQYDCYQ